MKLIRVGLRSGFWAGCCYPVVPPLLFWPLQRPPRSFKLPEWSSAIVDGHGASGATDFAQVSSPRLQSICCLTCLFIKDNGLFYNKVTCSFYLYAYKQKKANLLMEQIQGGNCETHMNGYLLSKKI